LPEALGELLGRFSLIPGQLRPSELGLLRRRWPQVVGERLALRTRPVLLRGRRLYLAVDSSAWAAELSYLRGELCRLIRERAGVEVEEILFTLRRARKEKAPEEPLPEEWREKARAWAGEIPDPRLRAKVEGFLLQALARRERCQRKKS